MFIWYALWYF